MDSELRALRKELAILGAEFSQRVQEIEKRIATLESKNVWADTSQSTMQTAPIESRAIPEEKPQESRVSEPNESILKEPPNKSVTNASSSPAIRTLSRTGDIAEPLSSNSPSEGSLNEGSIIGEETVQASPWIEEPQSLTKEVTKESFFALIAPLLGPLASVIEKSLGVYRHYQEQGKAPVFFMTITGVIALVLGFGYLLQYSFNEYLGASGKVILGFAVAIATTIGGVKFTRNHDTMGEYGSSLIALGIILNYLCAYFAGPYYGMVEGVAGFSLFVAVTFVAYLLALRFETRIVAIVSLVGGATLPLVMDHIDQSPILYLSYLLVLAVAMLRLSLKINWSKLALVTMALSVGMIELSITNAVVSLDSLSIIIVIHGFFYAFGYYALRGLSSSNAMDNTRLMVATSNLIFFLYISQTLIQDSHVLGLVFFLNTLPWVLSFLLPYKLFQYNTGTDEFRSVQAIALLHAGLLAGVGILVLSTPEMMGVIWCLEGLMLIYLGGKFQFASVRVEGYVALAISFGSMVMQTAKWIVSGIVPAPDLLSLSVGVGWGNLIAMTLFLFCAVGLLERQKDELNGRELNIIPLLDNLLSLFLGLSFLLTVAIFSVQTMWLASVIPMFYLIWRAQKNTLVISELLGWASYLLLFIPIVVSAGIVGNFHFSEQSLTAQIARVEAFACLWLVAEFYKRFCTESTNIEIALILQKLFYCLIPLFFLPSALRNYSEHFLLVLWGSCTIALLLYSRLQLAALKLELRLLVLLASAGAIYGCWLAEFEGWHGNAIGSLFAGIIFYGIIGWQGQGFRRVAQGSTSRITVHEALQPLFTVSIYYFALAIFIILYGFGVNHGLAILATLLYLSAVYFYRPTLPPIRSSLVLTYGVLLLLIILLTIVNVWNLYSSSPSVLISLCNVIAVGCGVILVYRPFPQSRAVWQRYSCQIKSIWCLNLIAVATYIAVLNQMFSSMTGPVLSFSLVVHGTIILFQTLQPRLKKLIWLSVLLYGVGALKILLWDMQDFSLIQKIVVFMLVGLCMLGAAFKFQKITGRGGIDAAQS